ncbi:MAG TPA: chemotaxis protein CheC [Chloroflexota bacterium]|nr:chemotaxis protein CheC [Chloroflexota bacterium]
MAVSKLSRRSRSTSETASDALLRAIRHAAERGAAALSEMAGRSITTETVALRTVPLAELSTLAGDPERPLVAIHLGVGGDGSGCILLALSEAAAYELVDMLLGQPEGTTCALEPLEVSALAEVGNVAGSFFLTALADGAHLTLAPTPPIVFYEMRGAILATLAAELMLLEWEDALVIETEFACDDQAVEVAFFMFPGPAMVQAVAEAVLVGVGDGCRGE